MTASNPSANANAAALCTTRSGVSAAMSGAGSRTRTLAGGTQAQDGQKYHCQGAQALHVPTAFPVPSPSRRKANMRSAPDNRRSARPRAATSEAMTWLPSELHTYFVARAELRFE